MGGHISIHIRVTGDEGGCAMNAIKNFAPHICIPLDSGVPGDGDKLCGLPPPRGPLPANHTGGWSSIIIEGGYLCSANSFQRTDILLEQVGSNNLACVPARHCSIIASQTVLLVRAGPRSARDQRREWWRPPPGVEPCRFASGL